METWNPNQGPYTGVSGTGQSSGYIQSVPAPPTNESPSQIRDAVSQSEQILSGLHDQIGSLEKRLDTVLSPVPPQTATGNKAGLSSAGGSHLLGRLQILNDGYVAALQRVQALIQRVEI